MKKMMALLLGCITALIATDAAAMISRARAAYQARPSFNSTIQSRAYSSRAALASLREDLNQNLKDREATINRFSSESMNKAWNSLPWYGRLFRSRPAFEKQWDLDRRDALRSIDMDKRFALNVGLEHLGREIEDENKKFTVLKQQLEAKKEELEDKSRHVARYRADWYKDATELSELKTARDRELKEARDAAALKKLYLQEETE